MTSRRSKVNSKKTQESLDSRAQKIDSENDEMQRKIQELTAEIKQLWVKLKTTKDKCEQNRIKAKIKHKQDLKKLYENRIEQRRSMSFNLDHASIQLRNAQDTKDTVKALKSGAKALKKQNKSLSEVEDVRETFDDWVQQSQAIQDSVSRPLHSQHQVDDDDEQLEEELDRLLAEPDEEAPLNGSEEMLSDVSFDVFDPRPSPGCYHDKPEDGLNGAGGGKKGRDGDRDPDIPGVEFIPIPFVVPILAALPLVLPVPLPPIPGVPPIVKNPFGKKGSSDDKPSKKNEGKEDKKQEKKKKDKKNECKEEKKNECEEEGDKDCKEEHEDRDLESPDLFEESSSEEEQEDKTGEQKTKKERTLFGRGIHRVKKRLGLAKQHNSGTADPVGMQPQPLRPYASRQENSHRSSSNNDTDSFADPDLNALEQWVLSGPDDRKSNINYKSEQCNTSEASGSSTSPSSIRSLGLVGSELNSSELHHYFQEPAFEQSDTKIEQHSRSEMSALIAWANIA